MRLSPDEIEKRVNTAFRRFLARYAKLGGHRFYGFRGHGDRQNYKGPMIWSEADCAFQFALDLEKQFRGMVHLEMPIAKFMIKNWDTTRHRGQFIDIVVSDLSEFVADEHEFWEHQHDLFVEAKFLGKTTKFTHKNDEKVDAIRRDAERLKRHLEDGHCRAAAVLVVDDGCVFEDSSQRLPWPAGVGRLVASPR